MGRAINDGTTSDVLAKLNKRFAPEQLDEMVSLQKEFKIFSNKHSLRQSFALLGIVPDDQAERPRWFNFLDKLHTYKSDLAGVKGDDQVINALAAAFEAKKPLPVFFRVHLASEDDRITVTRGQPVLFSHIEYSIISIPVTPAAVARQHAAETARKRRVEKKSKK
ncbi:hypothetical protein [Bradyrhizobium canariense]|uniref:Uncharacterized protein n=1 Tax=Bradyrhizobium canariense TaxID=255045 RepID=A0A1H1W631_9BRAD|nr:hypothetical protein [Bradyrhizobium canariense]SDS92170.1 hypothetical protein SAMN05444158_3692 [Bradyrhizobium canariense]